MVGVGGRVGVQMKVDVEIKVGVKVRVKLGDGVREPNEGVDVCKA